MKRRYIGLRTATAFPALPVAARADTRTNIVFWHAMSGQLGDTLVGIVNKFNASQTDVTVAAGL